MGDKLEAALHGATPAPARRLDRAALMAWLRTLATHRTPLVAAIYDGLAVRIERGDFDTTEETHRG
jgi:hypothetical protein